eukprot:13690685-Alexandrium_andersonii.AAC.1
MRRKAPGACPVGSSVPLETPGWRLRRERLLWDSANFVDSEPPGGTFEPVGRAGTVASPVWAWGE